MSAPHCCQAKKKKHSGLARDRSTVRQAKRNGRESSIRQGRFPPTARLFRRVITLQISLPPRRVRTDCSIHQIAQPWALEALPPSLDSGIPEIDVDQRLHDQSIVAQPGPSPPGNPPGNAVRPAGRSQQAARDFPLGGICSVFAVCPSRHPRTREHARCRVGYRIQRWMARCRGALPVGCGCLALSSSTIRVRWRCCC